MKTCLQIFVSLSLIAFLYGGCAKEGCTDPTATNYNSKATKNDGSCKYTCSATDYTGFSNCGSGYVGVSGGYCCPASKPYTCSSATSCYATCEEAKAAGCYTVEKGIYQTNGGGGGAGYNCNGSNCYSVSSGASYSTLSACQSSCGSSTCTAYDYTGSASCASGYVGVGSGCCPSNAPYYCSVTNYCYTTCESAKNAGCTNPVKGIYQTNGGGSSGYNCNGSSCYSVSSGASYSTLSACQSSCGTSSAGYICSGGTCSYVSSGASYSTLSACQSSCGGSSSTQLMFWNSNPNAGTISVYVDGSYVGGISSYYTSAPACGASGALTITRAPGTYSVSATWSAGGSSGPDVIQISGSCAKFQFY